MTVDAKSHDLASEFLADYKQVSPKHVQSLAEAIQQTVEDWLEDYEGMLAEPPYDTHEEKAGLR